MDHELVDLYAAESRLPRIVVAAFVSAGIEPPSLDRVDRIGYSAGERRLIDPLLSSIPND